ncbi:hypothetical protein JAAARDRAFT_72691 [Jaapia argillacea MUCL 33604]|uniref:Uncharacterized protein n=1 Tax=Jaapia argillacea MUCL 33604 TaxID=933084 RepID=A0A067PS77_9AGAM|nr:hypothetical protein JAAARDRAFT_72691 [Jaapia argillacea MUCL 33604]
MPKKGKGESDKGFTYSGSGTNNKGNHYCSRDYGNGSNAYHYSNKYLSSLQTVHFLPSIPELTSPPVKIETEATITPTRMDRSTTIVAMGTPCTPLLPAETPPQTQASQLEIDGDGSHQ